MVPGLIGFPADLRVGRRATQDYESSSGSLRGRLRHETCQRYVTMAGIFGPWLEFRPLGSPFGTGYSVQGTVMPLLVGLTEPSVGRNRYASRV